MENLIFETVIRWGLEKWNCSDANKSYCNVHTTCSLHLDRYWFHPIDMFVKNVRKHVNELGHTNYEYNLANCMLPVFTLV